MMRHIANLKRLTSCLAMVWFCGANADPVKTTATRPVPQAAAAATAVATLNPAGEGRRAYLKFNCYGCHGMRAAGGMGPNIVHAELGDLTEVLMEGGDSGMPSFRQYVTTTDISNLAAYLNSIGKTTEPKFNDWWVPVPLK